MKKKKSMILCRPCIWMALVMALALGGCVTVPLPQPRALSMEAPVAPGFEGLGPPVGDSGADAVPLPGKFIGMPRQGEKNAYGIVTTPELETAYDAYLGGDVEAALSALDQAESSASDPVFLWQISFLRAQILLVAGRAADSEEELVESAKREIDAFGHNWNAVALRGEVRVWLGDLDGAMADFAKVVRAVGGWRFPVSYGGPPDNMAELVAVTTAQLRSYTGLSGVHFLKKQYERALAWAEATESRFNDVHYVSGHPIYGSVIHLHMDSYYGRAMNLAFMAASRLVVTGDGAGCEAIFDRARAFFTAIGYGRGRVVVEALKALGLYARNNIEAAVVQADLAVGLAISQQMPDLVWRIDILRGKMLYDQGRIQDAETAFRRAQAGVEAVSGALATDRAKIRFGAGKEDITYFLSRIDARKGDYSALFQDMERGRARAFVDMLADEPVDGGEDAQHLSRIRSLDREVLRLRLMDMAPGVSKAGSRQAIARIMAERKAAVADLRRRNPDLADVLSVSAVPLSQIQTRLGEGEVMAYMLPARGDDPIELLMVDRDNARIKRLPATVPMIREALESFQRAVTGRSAARGIAVRASQGSRQGQIETVEKLSDHLAIRSWGAAAGLHVVPSGPLHFVPWGALPLDCPVAVLPTGGWLARRGRGQGTFHGMVVVGDPDFGGDLPQLPGARREALAVAADLGIEARIGKAATEANLRADLGAGKKILHLATHGIFYPDKPLKSAIFLSKEGRADALTAAEIFRYPLKARLVVLSACETGLGQTVAGDDMLGLVRSFYLGGSRSVVSSLWPVEDEGTLLFMEVFHRQAASGDYGRAWMAARNHLKEKRFPPSVYGAFILGGDMVAEMTVP